MHAYKEAGYGQVVQSHYLQLTATAQALTKTLRDPCCLVNLIAAELVVNASRTARCPADCLLR